MKTISVKASKPYDVTVGAGLLDDAGRMIRDAAGGRTAVVVTDDIVAALYADRLTDSLTQSGYRVCRYVFPHGEAAKNGATLLSLLNFMAGEKLTRADVAVALGGGVAGDLTGFAAACYMRGIKFVQMPTTLLAAADASVGGKTGIDLAAGKNLAGAFYQPQAVICDVDLLSTLPPEVFGDGCAETIKHGVIADRAFFDSLSISIRAQLTEVITRNVEIKRDIVETDERETGARKLLNFGHTLGHAVEVLSEYHTTHGQAVAVGMSMVTRAAARMGFCGADCVSDLAHMLRRYNLPEHVPYPADRLAAACLSDKKRDGDSITMVFPTKIGACVLKEIKVDELEAVIYLGTEG